MFIPKLHIYIYSFNNNYLLILIHKGYMPKILNSRNGKNNKHFKRYNYIFLTIRPLKVFDKEILNDEI